MSKLKGFSVVGLIVVLAAVAIVAAIIYFGFGGFGFGGGKGDGEGEGDSTSAAFSQDEPEEEEEEPEETEETTEEAVPVIEAVEYINITVSENEYLYQNSKLSLEELIAELSNMPDNLPVKLTDDNASLNAYRQLTEALDEHNIKYIEENMN